MTYKEDFNHDWSDDYTNDFSEVKEKKCKVHKCDSCGKLFYQAGNLKKHIYTVHEGHKDFKCDYCGKLFTRGYSLKLHIPTIHEGHKDNKCESCGKSFSQAGYLRKHIHTIHEGHKDSKRNLEVDTSAFMKKKEKSTNVILVVKRFFK